MRLTLFSLLLLLCASAALASEDAVSSRTLLAYKPRKLVQNWRDFLYANVPEVTLCFGDTLTFVWPTDKKNPQGVIRLSNMGFCPPMNADWTMNSQPFRIPTQPTRPNSIVKVKPTTGGKFKMTFNSPSQTSFWVADPTDCQATATHIIIKRC